MVFINTYRAAFRGVITTTHGAARRYLSICLSGREW